MTIHDAKALIGLCIDEGLKQGVLKNKGEFEELLDYLDKYFTDTGKITGGSSEIPKDLEEAADKYEKENTGIYPEVGQTSIRDAFIDGYNLCREQMMKVAVNGWLDEDNEPPYDLNVVCEEKIPFGKFKHGDKVKLIIIKED